MDFNSLDSRKAASTGRDLHLKHPTTGKLMYNDEPKNTEPCIVTVIGTESPIAQAAMREINRSKVKADKSAEGEQTIEDLHNIMVAAAKPLIIGFKNVLKGDIQATRDDAEWFLNLQMLTGQEGELSFVEQVAGFATKRANFLGNAPSA